LALHGERGDLDCVAAVHMHVDHHSPVVRKAAIVALGCLSPVDDAVAMMHLRRHLGSNDMEVQLVAFAALAQVAARGNKEVMHLMQEKSADEHAATRCAAMEAVGHVAIHGDIQALAHVRQGMTDSNASVRKASVTSFVQLVKQGDQRAALILIRCLEDMDDSVRQAAVQAVGSIVEKDNDAALGALSERLEHRYLWVSWAAAKALGEVAAPNQPNVVAAIVAHLGNESPSTRQVALQVLAQVASKGNELVINGLKSHLQHHDAGVRKTAVRALAKFGAGERQAIKAATKLLEHSKQRVRKSAVDALKLLVATQGIEQAQEELSERLHHNRSEVRLAAISGLVAIGVRNDLWVIEELVRAALDRDALVQEAATAAFEKLVDKGHPHAIFNLIGLLDIGGDGHALQATVQLLPRVAGCSDKSLQLVSSLLEKQSLLVRNSLFEALMQVSDQGYRQCVFAMCSCWEGSGAEEAPSGAGQTAYSLDSGVSVATQALSSCLLQPGIYLPEAVASALAHVGVRGEGVATDLHTCMSRRRWFIRWQSVEYMCRAALEINGAPACSTTSAKAFKIPLKRSPVEDKGPIIQLETLHRRDCPCVAHAKQPTKKAKTSHRPFTEDDGPSAQAHTLQHIDCKRPDAAADVKNPSKRARFAGA